MKINEIGKETIGFVLGSWMSRCNSAMPLRTNPLDILIDYGTYFRETLRYWFDTPNAGRLRPGEYLTTAQWMREFIQSHPDYKKDSVVSDTVTYDLLWRCCQIASGEVEEKKLFPKPKNKSVYSMPPGTKRHNPNC